MSRRILGLLALGMVVGCSTPVTGPDGIVTLSEFSVVAPASISGFITVDLVNKGEMSHTLVVADADGRVVTSSDVVGPGERGRLELDLLPGEYEFTCRIVLELPDGTIGDHYARGMETDVVVGA